MGEHSSGVLGVLEVLLEHEEYIHREGDLWVSLVEMVGVLGVLEYEESIHKKGKLWVSIVVVF